MKEKKNIYIVKVVNAIWGILYQMELPWGVFVAAYSYKLNMIYNNGALSEFKVGLKVFFYSTESALF